ncbi:DUF1273 family protein [Terrilactibacillus sp. BCM23-1]|uniref:UPF0398 protein GMB86_13035 n=1 Tax=Terrilactibacillus tamarindi TaxID=2599694 RepID=A0A6N8CSA4_9BACI|nr:DUF1273 domain-containing protein [Terrilactibacillus tamarindi]MTT32931.1 DUF1273 family protein [Terrilactibacillus tamarindi]
MQVFLITGYKPHELGIFSEKHEGIRVIKHCIRSQILQLVEEGVQWFIISGQLGVEIWAAEEILTLKEEGYEMKLAVLPPFYEQEERWSETMKETYQRILSEADFTDFISKRPYQSPLQLKQKNDFLVDKSDGILLLYDTEQPGTPKYYLQAANIKNKRGHYPIRFITRYDIESAAEELREQDPNYWTQG